jgi:hypothetical protein
MGLVVKKLPLRRRCHQFQHANLFLIPPATEHKLRLQLRLHWTPGSQLDPEHCTLFCPTIKTVPFIYISLNEGNYAGTHKSTCLKCLPKKLLETCCAFEQKLGQRDSGTHCITYITEVQNLVITRTGCIHKMHIIYGNISHELKGTKMKTKRILACYMIKFSWPTF